MTSLKKLRKLGNAIRAQRGLTREKGNPLLPSEPLKEVPIRRDLAPRKDAKATERVERWEFRLKQSINP